MFMKSDIYYEACPAQVLDRDVFQSKYFRAILDLKLIVDYIAD